jgi:hypothetical protein
MTDDHADPVMRAVEQRPALLKDAGPRRAAGQARAADGRVRPLARDGCGDPPSNGRLR